MSESLQALTTQLQSSFPAYAVSVAVGEVTMEVPAEALLSTANTLRDEQQFQFEQLIDLCAVDYSHYGKGEWEADEATSTGFSRGVEASTTGRLKFGDSSQPVESEQPRFAVVYHLLSYTHNRRLRLRVYAPDNEMPIVASVTQVWSVADWFEREAFDLFGVIFEGHPDLRRILTDYGFIGHPFRKDYPLIGNVEMRYDPEKGRVVYQPVTIEPRVLVPKVIRDDHRYVTNDSTQSEGE